MRHPLRVLALACTLAFTPACSSLHLGEARFENPAAAARTLDQRAYALINTYAAIVEEATDVVADPNTPLAVKRALGRAEAAATPAAHTLEIAVAGYLRARADFSAASSGSQPALERAATALTIAARRLSEAADAAEAPIAELETLVRTRS